MAGIFQCWLRAVNSTAVAAPRRLVFLFYTSIKFLEPRESSTSVNSYVDARYISALALITKTVFRHTYQLCHQKSYLNHLAQRSGSQGETPFMRHRNAWF